MLNYYRIWVGTQGGHRRYSSDEQAILVAKRYARMLRPKLKDYFGTGIYCVVDRYVSCPVTSVIQADPPTAIYSEVVVPPGSIPVSL